AVEKGTLAENESVEYEIGEGHKGPCAVQVKSLS
ncbi:cold-shock DNA-binding domain protein, partial [Bacteriovorax sp. DB6_IX]